MIGGKLQVPRAKPGHMTTLADSPHLSVTPHLRVLYAAAAAPAAPLPAAPAASAAAQGIPPVPARDDPVNDVKLKNRTCVDRWSAQATMPAALFNMHSASQLQPWALWAVLVGGGGSRSRLPGGFGVVRRRDIRWHGDGAV